MPNIGWYRYVGDLPTCGPMSHMCWDAKNEEVPLYGSYSQKLANVAHLWTWSKFQTKMHVYQISELYLNSFGR